MDAYEMFSPYLHCWSFYISSDFSSPSSLRGDLFLLLLSLVRKVISHYMCSINMITDFSIAGYVLACL